MVCCTSRSWMATRSATMVSAAGGGDQSTMVSEMLRVILHRDGSVAVALGSSHPPFLSWNCVLGKHILDICCGAARLRRAAPQQAILRGRRSRPRTPTVYGVFA